MAQIYKHGRCFLTPEGGVAVYLTNRTQDPSIKGMLITPSCIYDNAFYENSPSDLPCGAVYESGIAVGRECPIVFTGRAQVLLEDGLASDHSNYVFVSGTTAGRADASQLAEPGDPNFFVVGRCLETLSLGTNVLCYVMLQFYMNPRP